MIKSVHLKNFQKHKDLKLDFIDGVNILRGPSDVGKSSCIRALEYVAFNRPAGDAMRTWGAKFVEVTVVTDEHTITRRKDSKFNGYIVDGQEHAAVGRDVPEAVRNALPLHELCFSTQHSAPFLLSESAGSVGKQLNDLVDLSIIDTTISGINRRVKDHNKTISVLEETEKQQAEVLKRYKGINKASDTLKDLKTAHNIYSGRLSKSLKLEAILRQSYKYVELVKGKELICGALVDVDTIAHFALEVKSKNSRIISLQKLISRYNDTLAVQNGIGDVDAAMSALDALVTQNDRVISSRLQIKELSDNINVYSEAQNRLGVLGYIPDALRSLDLIVDVNRGVQAYGLRVTKLEQTIKKLQRAENDLKTKIEVEKEMKEEYNARLKEGGVCPFCQSPVGLSVESCSGC